MKTEDARQVVSSALSVLSAELKAGHSEQMTLFLQTLSRFHRYSFGNVMLILAQRPDATQVAGLHSWKRLGRSVAKGQKGITILAPVVISLREPQSPADDDPVTPTPVLRFRAVTVFDISQTEGKPLPAPPSVQGDPGACLAALKSLVASKCITVSYGDVLFGAEGVSRGGSISIAVGLNPAREFSVLTHELAHELLHHAENADRGTRTTRETEAEAVAFVVCRAIGLDVGTAARDYILSHCGDAAILAASLARIQRTAATIIETVQGHSGPDANTATGES